MLFNHFMPVRLNKKGSRRGSKLEKLASDRNDHHLAILSSPSALVPVPAVNGKRHKHFDSLLTVRWIALPQHEMGGEAEMLRGSRCPAMARELSFAFMVNELRGHSLPFLPSGYSPRAYSAAPLLLTRRKINQLSS